MKEAYRLTTSRPRLTLTLLFAMLSSSASTMALMQMSSDSQSESRKAEIQRLRQIIRDEQIQQQDPEQVDKAMRRLGELKAVEAIDDLIALLAFKYPKGSRTVGSHYGDGYGAKSALYQIGKPALPVLVRALADNDINSIEFKNARLAVMNIFRDDLPAGSQYLREQARQASSSVAEARLWAAAQWIDDFRNQSEAMKARDKDPR